MSDQLDRITNHFHDRYRELLEGMPAGEPTWVTSGGPEGGIHGTLAALTAAQASQEIGGTTIASQTEHLRWAMQLVNDFFRGNVPPSDWSASWTVHGVDEAAWDALRASMRSTGEELLANIAEKHEWVEEMWINGALSSLAHTAYHLGAIRQLAKLVN